MSAGPISFPEPAARDWGFPRSVAGIRALTAYARRRGLDAAPLLVGTGLAEADLGDPGREVTAAQELAVARALRRHLGEVGADVGATYRAETFGAFGFALLSSPTVYDAARTALRFIDLSFAFAIPRAAVAGEEVVVTLHADALPADIAGFLLARDAVAVRVVLDSLVPGGVVTSLAFDELTATVRLPVDQLARPLPDRSADRLAAAEAACRDVVGRRRTRSGFTQDVRILITQRLRDGAPMGDVAAALGLTERTLRRRLAAEGTAYRELLDEVRSSLADALLDGRTTMPLADVAQRLGYASPAALAHARARWRSSSVRHGPFTTVTPRPRRRTTRTP